MTVISNRPPDRTGLSIAPAESAKRRNLLDRPETENTAANRETIRDDAIAREVAETIGTQILADNGTALEAQASKQSEPVVHALTG